MRGEQQRSVEGGLRRVRGKLQRTVGGCTSAREGRTAANCCRVVEVGDVKIFRADETESG